MSGQKRLLVFSNRLAISGSGTCTYVEEFTDVLPESSSSRKMIYRRYLEILDEPKASSETTEKMMTPHGEVVILRGDFTNEECPGQVRRFTRVRAFCVVSEEVPRPTQSASRVTFGQLFEIIHDYIIVDPKEKDVYPHLLSMLVRELEKLQTDPNGQQVLQKRSYHVFNAFLMLIGTEDERIQKISALLGGMVQAPKDS